MLSIYYADLHIHIGRTRDGYPVKVTAAMNQTLANVFAGAVELKGLDIVGIVDAVCPRLGCELEEMVASGELVPLPGGGLRYRERLTVIPGAEMETSEPGGGHSHWLAYFPGLAELHSFSDFLAGHLTNPQLSTQVCHLSAAELLPQVISREGIFLPAHAFTPHKGVYGQCTGSLAELLGERNFSLIPALELGLSADTEMADQISELVGVTFLSNSDAHSIKNIAREYNALRLERPDGEELLLALRRKEGRGVAANYGLHPRLGKYHRSFCLSCQQIATSEPPVTVCPHCGSSQMVMGVYDRLCQIRDRRYSLSPQHRPPYIHQVPLLFLPGVGPRMLAKLVEHFGNEMNILHRTAAEDLAGVAGAKIGRVIDLARRGELAISAGGGGRYGRVKL